MRFKQYELKMPMYTNNLLVRERRKKHYLSLAKAMYGNLPKLTKEKYNQIAQEFYCGSEIAKEELADLSIGCVANSVADIYSKFDIEDVLPFEEALSTVLQNYLNSLKFFDVLPRFFSEYASNVINRYTFAVIIRIYREYGVRQNVNVPLQDEVITSILDEQECEEFPMDLFIERNNIFNDVLNAHYLKDREKEILSLKFGFNNQRPMSFKEIAKHVNLSVARVQQIFYKTLGKIKEQVKIDDYII